MGSNTYKSIGKALENRENLVLSRCKDYKLCDAKVFHSVDDVLTYVKEKEEEVFVIGGSQIVELFLPYSSEAIITKIFIQKEADTHLHNFDKDPDFEIINQSKIFEEDGIKFQYITYRRK